MARRGRRENVPPEYWKDALLEDFSEWVNRRSCTSIFHPFRAVCLARTAAGLSAREVAQLCDLSPSYLTALENYTRPLTPDTCVAFRKLARTLNGGFLSKELSLFRDILFSLINKQEIEFLFLYFSYFWDIASVGDLSIPLEVLLFEYVASLTGEVSVIYHDVSDLFDISGEARPPAQRLRVLWESNFLNWPKYKVPRMILVDDKNIILGYLLGVVSATELVKFYQDRFIRQYSPFPSQTTSWMMFDRLSLRRHSKLMGLIALAAFLFSDLSVRLTAESVISLSSGQSGYLPDPEVNVGVRLRFSEIGPLHFFFSDYIRGIPPEQLPERINNLLKGPTRRLLQRLEQKRNT
ncbi:helix-turn-helix domain-containing protein [Desulfothermobacter acidiphilus]|uniref:helix-turn-helix domain-containing protein n=1 Tax=Desulfothermobacter acidiphilus TaxID=1938353 RepID=UPI003F88F524